jgi:hypothetical protein
MKMIVRHYEHDTPKVGTELFIADKFLVRLFFRVKKIKKTYKVETSSHGVYESVVIVIPIYNN